MMRNAYVLLLLTTLFWGGNAVAGKLAVGHISPMLLNTLRWGLAGAVLLIIGLPQLRRDWPVVRANLPLLFILGAAGFTVFNIALYAAVHFTTVINVSIEQAGMPLFILLGNFLLYRMAVSMGQLIGFTLSVIGVALTATHGDLTRLADLDVNFGDALMLVAVIVYAGYTIGLRYKPDIHWKSLVLVLVVSAFLSSVPFAIWEMRAGQMILPDARGCAVVIYAALLPSIGSQIFFIRGVELIGANRAGLFINMVPIFGTILSLLIIGESFHLYHAVALALVLGGIWLAEQSSRKQAARP